MAIPPKRNAAQRTIRHGLFLSFLVTELEGQAADTTSGRGQQRHGNVRRAGEVFQTVLLGSKNGWR